MAARWTLWATVFGLLTLAPTTFGCAADAEDDEGVGSTDEAITARTFRTKNANTAKWIQLAGLPIREGLVKVNGKVEREGNYVFLIGDGQVTLDVPPRVAKCIYSGPGDTPKGCSDANALQITDNVDVQKARLVKGSDSVPRYDLTEWRWAPAGTPCVVFNHRDDSGVLRKGEWRGRVEAEPRVYGKIGSLGTECRALSRVL